MCRRYDSTVTSSHASSKVGNEQRPRHSVALQWLTWAKRCLPTVILRHWPVLAFCLAWPSSVGDGAAGAFRSLRPLLSSLLSLKILLPLFLYSVWMFCARFLASLVGLWGSYLWKPAVLWFILSGIGLIFGAVDAIREPSYFRQAIRRAVRIVIVVEFLANLRSFPLWIEIPGGCFALFAATIPLAGSGTPDQEVAARLANRYLTVYGLSAVAWAAWHLATSWPDLDHGVLLREFLLPIWLTPVALIFVYCFAVAVAYETSFIQMRIGQKEGNLTRQRLAVALRAGGSLRTLRLLRLQRSIPGCQNGRFPGGVERTVSDHPRAPPTGSGQGCSAATTHQQRWSSRSGCIRAATRPARA